MRGILVIFLHLEILVILIWQHYPFSKFTIGFLVWLFSTHMVLNVQTSSQPSSPSLEQHQPQVDPKVDPFPSSIIVSSSFYSSSHRESVDSSN